MNFIYYKSLVHIVTTMATLLLSNQVSWKCLYSLLNVLLTYSIILNFKNMLESSEIK